MSARAEVLGDGIIGREEPLGVARCFEPLHPSLPLSCGLMGVLRAIIEIAMLTLFYPWEDLPLGRSIALEFVGDDHARYVGQSFKKFTKELLRGFLVPTALDQDIQDVALLIDRSPEIMTLTLDHQKHLVQVSLVTGPRPSPTQLIGISLTKLATPLADGLIGDDHTTFQEEFFHITKTQAEAKVQPHGVTDDLNGKAVVLIVRGSGWCIHAATLSYRIGADKLTMPC
jgi:hypothetical protein